MDPAIRSAITKELLLAVRGWEAGPAAAVLEAVGETGIQAIERAAPIGWMDFGVHMLLSDAIRAEVGSAGNVETWSRVFLEVSRRPLLDSFFAAMFRISGPAAAFKSSARVFNLTNRGIGTYAYTPGADDDGCRISLTGFPTRYTVQCYAEGLLGALRAIMGRSNSNGRVEIDHVDASRGDIVYALHW